MISQLTALFWVLFLLFGHSSGQTDKPITQDKFTFEEQLLKKVIHMEHKMVLMDAALQQTKGRMSKSLQNLTLEVENKTAESEQLGEKVSIPMIAFNAYSPVDISLETNQIMVLQNTYINEGNAYDTVLGIFTAPVAGLYMFTVNACTYSKQPFYFYIIVDNSAIAVSTKFNNAAVDCAATTTLTKIQAGQRVWVKCASGGASTNVLYENNSYQTTFSGALLHG